MASEVMRGKSEKGLNKLRNCSNGMPNLARVLKLDNEEFEGTCLQSRDENLCRS